MVHPFSIREYRSRIEQLAAELKQRGLAAMLLFAPASVYYFTGYNMASYPQLQALLVSANRHTTLITPFSHSYLPSSLIDEVMPWGNSVTANPARALWEIVERRFGPQRIGAEHATATLDAWSGTLLEASFVRTLDVVDASDLVPALRLKKSDAELVYVRQAAKITDAAFRQALKQCRSNASQSNFLAELYRGVLSEGGEPVIGRYVHGHGMNAPSEGASIASNQFNIEFAAAYRYYQVALTRTILTDRASPEQGRMHAAAIDALEACRKTLQPGKTFGDVFDAHAITLDRRGYHRARLNACGYSLGAASYSSWPQSPTACAGNSTELIPGAVVFLNVALSDPETGATMTLGESYIVTRGAPERLSSLDYSLFVQ